MPSHPHDYLHRVLGLCVLLACQWLGHLTQNTTALPLPGSLIGLLFFFAFLVATRGGWKGSRQASHDLISVMPLLFIPVGCGLILFTELIQKDWLPLLLALVPASWLAMVVIARLANRGRAEVDV